MDVMTNRKWRPPIRCQTAGLLLSTSPGRTISGADWSSTRAAEPPFYASI
jgi:hypothetical protein